MDTSSSNLKRELLRRSKQLKTQSAHDRAQHRNGSMRDPSNTGNTGHLVMKVTKCSCPSQHNWHFMIKITKQTVNHRIESTCPMQGHCTGEWICRRALLYFHTCEQNTSSMENITSLAWPQDKPAETKEHVGNQYKKPYIEHTSQPTEQAIKRTSEYGIQWLASTTISVLR